MEASGLDPAFFAYRERDLGEVFPWAHINIGVTPSYLRNEWVKTLRQETTPDCHKTPCNVCGVQNQNADDCLNRLDLRLAQQGKPPKDRTGLRAPIELFSVGP